MPIYKERKGKRFVSSETNMIYRDWNVYERNGLWYAYCGVETVVGESIKEVFDKVDEGYDGIDEYWDGMVPPSFLSEEDD